MPGLKKMWTLQIIGNIIIYLGMNPEMKDNAMGGGRDGGREASLESLIIWRKKWILEKLKELRNTSNINAQNESKLKTFLFSEYKAFNDFLNKSWRLLLTA